MNTDDLIKTLAQDTAIPNHHWVRRLGFAFFIAAPFSIMMVWLSLGLNEDIPNLLGNGQFLTKMLWFLLMAASGFWVLGKSLCPDQTPGRHFYLPCLLQMGMLVAGGVSFVAGGMVERDLFGMSWSACPLMVLAFSLPLLSGSLAAVRVMAPANPGLAGLAAGIMSGGLGAFIYGLHCPELALPFIAIWYALGMLLVAGLGFVAGRIVLRW